MYLVVIRVIFRNQSFQATGPTNWKSGAQHCTLQLYFSLKHPHGLLSLFIWELLPSFLIWTFFSLSNIFAIYLRFPTSVHQFAHATESPSCKFASLKAMSISINCLFHRASPSAVLKVETKIPCYGKHFLRYERYLHLRGQYFY